MSTAADPKVAPDTRASRKKANRHLSDRARGERKLGWMLAGPAFVIMVGVTAYPILQAVYTSLFNYRLTDPQGREFVWFQNYVTALTDVVFWRICTAR